MWFSGGFSEKFNVSWFLICWDIFRGCFWLPGGLSNITAVYVLSNCSFHPAGHTNLCTVFVRKSYASSFIKKTTLKLFLFWWFLRITKIRELPRNIRGLDQVSSSNFYRKIDILIFWFFFCKNTDSLMIFFNILIKIRMIDLTLADVIKNAGFWSHGNRQCLASDCSTQALIDVRYINMHSFYKKIFTRTSRLKITKKLEQT